LEPEKSYNLTIVLKKAFEHSVFRFLFVGGLTYIVDIAVLVGLYSGLHTNRTVAAGVSFWVGLFFSFALQKLVAFQDYQKEVKALSRQAAWYAVLIAFNYILTLVIVSWFPGKDIILSRTIAVAITAAWNYFFYKKIIFRNGDIKNDQNNNKG
jgi:putative flippase GtrA